MSPRSRVALLLGGLLLAAGVAFAQGQPAADPPPVAPPPVAPPPVAPVPPPAAQPAPEAVEPAPAEPADEAAEDEALDQELDDIAADEAPPEEPAAEPHEPAAAQPSEPASGEHGAAPEHGAGDKLKDAHEQGHDEHAAGFGDINWFHGFVGEKDGVEPSLLWRPKGTPVPFLANLINSAILFYLLIRYGARPVSDALKKRKAAIMQGIDEAAKMKKEAEGRLADYEDKLKHIDDEIERVKQEIREAGAAEREHILREARERRARMERDTQALINAELKAARDALLAETVRASVATAKDVLSQKLTSADQQRMADEFLSGLKNNGAGAKS